MIKDDLIRELQSIMKQNKITQQKMGELMGVSRQRIHSILNGNGSEEILESMINILGYTVEVRLVK